MIQRGDIFKYLTQVFIGYPVIQWSIDRSFLNNFKSYMWLIWYFRLKESDKFKDIPLPHLFPFPYMG